MSAHLNPDNLISLDHIGKLYSSGRFQVPALQDINLVFPRGEFCAIMGPSGSGKSTLLNLLGCLDRPSSGHFWFEGTDVATLVDDALSDFRLHRLGFVFQSFHLVPQLTVQENIELPLYYLGLPPEECASRVKVLAEAVGMTDRLRHRPAELSGGQRQRTAIARALANNPALILADEPTGNLDSATSQQSMELFLDLNREGRTIIMVTHEPDIAAFASRRLHLRDGRVERID